MNRYSDIPMDELLEYAEELRSSRPPDALLDLLVEIAYRLYLHAVCCKDI